MHVFTKRVVAVTVVMINTFHKTVIKTDFLLHHGKPLHLKVVTLSIILLNYHPFNMNEVDYFPEVISDSHQTLGQDS